MAPIAAFSPTYFAVSGAGKNTHYAVFERASIQLARIAISTVGAAGVNVLGSRTVSAWVRTLTNPGGGDQYTICNIWGANGNERNFDFHLGGATQYVRALVQTSSGIEQNQLAWSPSTGTWYHLAWTYDTSLSAGSRIVFYINGVSQGSGSSVTTGTTTTLRATAGYYGIGARATGGANGFNGNIDDVRVFSGVRSAVDIAADYATQIESSVTGLQAYHKLNNSWAGSSTNAYELTPVNSPTFSSTAPLPFV